MYRDNVESLSDRLLLTLLGSNIHNNPPIYRRTQHWSWYDEPGRPPALDQAQQRADQPLPARYQPQVAASHLTIITSYDWSQTDWTRRITYYLLQYYYAEFSDADQGVGVLWRRLPENIIFQPQRIICGITFTSFLSGFPIFWSFDLFVVWIEFCLLYFYNPFFRILCCLQNKCYLVWCR